MTGAALAVHYSAKRPDWETPPDLFAAWDARFGFTLDACATPANAKCARFFSPADDGLAQDWGTETVWVNPPYGRPIARWMAKAWDATRRGATVVLLVPARTDTAWWHDYAAKGEIHFLRGRVKFLTDGQPMTHASRTGGTPAPFPSAIVIFRPDTDEAPAP